MRQNLPELLVHMHAPQMIGERHSVVDASDHCSPSVTCHALSGLSSCSWTIGIYFWQSPLDSVWSRHGGHWPVAGPCQERPRQLR